MLKYHSESLGYFCIRFEEYLFHIHKTKPHSFLHICILCPFLTPQKQNPSSFHPNFSFSKWVRDDTYYDWAACLQMPKGLSDPVTMKLTFIRLSQNDIVNDTVNLGSLLYPVTVTKFLRTYLWYLMFKQIKLFHLPYLTMACGSQRPFCFLHNYISSWFLQKK